MTDTYYASFNWGSIKYKPYACATIYTENEKILEEHKHSITLVVEESQEKIVTKFKAFA